MYATLTIIFLQNTYVLIFSLHNFFKQSFFINLMAITEAEIVS